MRAYDLILKKRNKEELTTKEISFLIEGYMKGFIPDYQISSLLMAIYFNGLNIRETVDLTIAMVNSGSTIDLSDIKGIKVDKHSTGGVGDKISLIVIPLIASLGIPVAKVSGRGLGHTGGTIDKLESIKGFKTELTKGEFITNVNKYKMAVVSQSQDITPADKKLYALRDVTATVDSIPLIASSIMSKKIATGADAIVLDVKVGSGAFMKSIDKARELAMSMVNIGKSLNIKTTAVITDMNQPLGYEIGNANEVKEAVQVLKGQGSKDEVTIALTIASYMAIQGGAFSDFNKAYKALADLIETNVALDKFKKLIEIQGGDVSFIEDFEKLPRAKYCLEVKSHKEGFVSSIDAESIGITAMLLGAGRAKKDDRIDHSAGITLLKKLGDKVRKNDVLCILHTNIDNHQEVKAKARQSFSIDKSFSGEHKYIYDVIQ